MVSALGLTGYKLPVKPYSVKRFKISDPMVCSLVEAPISAMLLGFIIGFKEGNGDIKLFSVFRG